MTSQSRKCLSHSLKRLPRPPHGDPGAGLIRQSLWLRIAPPTSTGGRGGPATPSERTQHPQLPEGSAFLLLGDRPASGPALRCARVCSVWPFWFGFLKTVVFYFHFFKSTKHPHVRRANARNKACPGLRLRAVRSEHGLVCPGLRDAAAGASAVLGPRRGLSWAPPGGLPAAAHTWPKGWP